MDRRHIILLLLLLGPSDSDPVGCLFAKQLFLLRGQKKEKEGVSQPFSCIQNETSPSSCSPGCHKSRASCLHGLGCWLLLAPTSPPPLFFFSTIVPRHFSPFLSVFALSRNIVVVVVVVEVLSLYLGAFPFFLGQHGSSQR